MKTQFESIEEVEELAANWNASQWVSANNTYCSENGYTDNEIFDFDDDFFNTFFESKPMEAARSAHFGEINWNDDYITFNGYGNLKSISKYAVEREIDTKAIIEDILENPENYDF